MVRDGIGGDGMEARVGSSSGEGGRKGCWETDWVLEGTKFSSSSIYSVLLSQLLMFVQVFVDPCQWISPRKGIKYGMCHTTKPAPPGHHLPNSHPLTTIPQPCSIPLALCTSHADSCQWWSELDKTLISVFHWSISFKTHSFSLSISLTPTHKCISHAHTLSKKIWFITSLRTCHTLNQ